jgi:hypothetical protein
MHLSPEDEQAIREAFDALVNLEPAELRAWLKRPESLKVGMIRRGETESVGRQSAKMILAIRAKDVGDLSDADYRHMKKVIGYCRRHLAQRPQALRNGGGCHRHALALEPDELGPRSASGSQGRLGG